MDPMERAVAATLAAFPPSRVPPALAEAALILARRLDAEPNDREATMLSRELRIVLAEVRDLAGAAGSDLDEFLASVTVEEFDGRR